MISIIIPYYNIKKEYIFDCLNSIQKQNKIDNIEVIIVDDGSKIPLRTIIQKDLYWFPLKIITTKNLGVSHARNIGIENSKGDYITFLDGDDMFDYNSLEYLNKNYIDDVIFFKSRSTSKIKNKVDEVERLSEFSTDEMEIVNCILKHKELYGFQVGSPWAKLFKKEFLIKNQINFIQGMTKSQDRAFMCDLMLSSPTFSFKDESLYIYRDDNMDSICNKYNQNIDLILQNSVEKIYEILVKHNKEIEFQESFEILKLNFFFNCLELKWFNSKNSQSGKRIKKEINSFLEYNQIKLKNSLFLKSIPLKRRVIFLLVFKEKFFVLKLIFRLKDRK